MVVRQLTNLTSIKTPNFSLGIHTERKTGNLVHNEEDQVGDGEGITHASETISNLMTDLNPVLIEPATRNDGNAIESSNVGLGENTGKNVTNETTNAMDGEDIKSIIIIEGVLQLAGEVANDTTDDTKCNRSGGANITRSGSDGNQTNNGTTAETEGRKLALKAVVHNHPGEATDSSSEVGHDTGHGSTDVTGDGGTTVEAEPAEPKEAGTEYDIGHVVRLEFLSAVTLALAKNEGVGERGSTRADVDGSTAGEVETASLVGPAGDVPDPVGNWVINDGGPDKDEEDHGEEAATLGSGTNSKGGGNGGEHTLENAEHNIGNCGVAHGGFDIDTTQEGIGKITNEGIG